MSENNEENQNEINKVEENKENQANQENVVNEPKTEKKEKTKTVKEVESPTERIDTGFKQIKPKTQHTGFKSFLKFIIFVLIVGIIGINGYNFIILRDKNNIESISKKLDKLFTLTDKQFEYGAELKVADLKLSEGVKLYINGQEVVDKYKFEKVGELKVTEKAQEEYINLIRISKNVERENNVIFKIIDTQMPVIEGVSDKEILLGSGIDLTEGIKAKDIVDGELKVEIEGNVNKDEVGDNVITVKAKDKNGNETSTQFTVKVVEQLTTVIEPLNPDSIITPEQPVDSNATETPEVPKEFVPEYRYTEESKILNLVNQKRAERGLAPLQIDNNVARIARLRAMDLAKANSLSHDTPTYGNPFAHLVQAGIQYSAAAENIAAAATSENAVANWIASPGHRGNILDSAYTHTGIGVVSDKEYGLKFVQIFIKK